MQPAGRVHSVNVSAGGVPKLPVERAWVGRLGLTGDGHHDVTEHGGPHRAVCLFALEAIERLTAEGHPVEPGSVGENLTTTGIEWSLLPVGTRARIGAQLELELASPTTPCATQEPNFRDGRFSRISIDLHPSDSRMYARVLSEGEVAAGDPITLLPAIGSRAADELLLARLDRAEIKSAVAAWQAAAAGGFDVRIVEDGELAMAASPDIPGPAYNHVAGLAQLPNLTAMATDFYDANGCPGWLITDGPPWAGANVGLVLGVYAGSPGAVDIADPPAGIHLRRLRAGEGDLVEGIYRAAGSVGGHDEAAASPWPAVYDAFASHPHRVVLLAELNGDAVAVASLHTHRGAGWLRGAAVVPEARGRGIQRALISARVRLAAELGCDLVGAWAEPGEVSAANLERMGMRAIGVREHYLYTPPGAAGVSELPA
jgi:MOSC domain-containing protein YiiM/GNAT superfamily N-acetyltransferase